jgi:hypothetical protein
VADIVILQAAVVPTQKYTDSGPRRHPVAQHGKLILPCDGYRTLRSIKLIRIRILGKRTPIEQTSSGRIRAPGATMSGRTDPICSLSTGTKRATHRHLQKSAQ